jgi:hypothetical protein
MFPPPSEPPPPPPPVAAKPAAAFDDENETTHVFDKDRHALDGAPPSGAAQTQLFGDDETTRVFDKDKHAGEDENETTHVFDSDRHGPKRVPVRAGGTKIGLGVPKPPAVPSDRPAPSSLKTPPPIPPPAPAEKPGLKTIRIERRSDKAPAPPAQTVIVQEHTDPAIFRQSDSILSRVGHWVWDDPAKRGFRVGLPAGFVVFFAVLFASSGHGGRTQRPSKTGVTEVAEEARDPAPKAAAQEEPRGVDPSTLPPAEDEPGPADDDTGERKSKTRRVSRPSPPAEARVAAVDRTPAPQAPAAAPPPNPPEVPAPAAPAPKPASDDVIESPYEKPSKPSAAPAAQKPAAKPKKSSAADCSNPFTVDADGIKRIRPECL